VWLPARPGRPGAGPVGGTCARGCHPFLFFFFLLKATTQLARKVHQERTQVVCSKKVGWNRLAESNGTPATDPGHRNIDLT